MLLKTGRAVGLDLLVACDAKPGMTRSRVWWRAEGLRPLYVGPLAMDRIVERITPLLLNVAKLNGLKRLSVKPVS